MYSRKLLRNDYLSQPDSPFSVVSKIKFFQFTFKKLRTFFLESHKKFPSHHKRFTVFFKVSDFHSAVGTTSFHGTILIDL